jgi:hypothetical protein
MRPMEWPTQLPLIAILRGIRPDEALAHAQALVDAGFDAIEIPLNSPDWAASVRSVAAAFGARALIGGGTVLREDEADALAAAGGRLVVTPNTRPALIAHAVRSGLHAVPGHHLRPGPREGLAGRAPAGAAVRGRRHHARQPGRLPARRLHRRRARQRPLQAGPGERAHCGDGARFCRRLS